VGPPAPDAGYRLPRYGIVFPTGITARAVDSPPGCAGPALASALGLAGGRPTIVVNGTATELDPSLAPGVAAVLGPPGLAALAATERLVLVTGGTDAGIFSILGQSVADRSVPLVGVAPRDLVTWPGCGPPGPRPGAIPLEPHHSHFVLVDGAAWGDETPALLALAAALSDGAGSVAVICGGGPVTRNEALGHARAGRPMVVLAGSGRFADELAAAPLPGARITVCPLAAGPDSLVDALLAALGRP
jgi:TRPM family ion channel